MAAVLSAVAISACNVASFGGSGSGSVPQSASVAVPPSSTGTSSGTAVATFSNIAAAPPPPSYQPVGQSGPVQITVFSATTNLPIAGATVVLNTSKTTATTNAAGQVTVSYTAADGAATASATGYASDTQALDPSGHMQMYLSPDLSGDEVRFILSWGTHPADLDGHLYYQPSNGKEFHVWWENKQTPYASQDVDAQNGYGPETITVSNLVAGNYSYVVADYTDCVDAGYPNNRLSANSAARVRLIFGNETIEYDVPKGQSGRVWSVLSFVVAPNHTATLTNVNAMSDECGSYLPGGG